MFRSLDFIDGSHRSVLNGRVGVWETGWLSISGHARSAQGWPLVEGRGALVCLGFRPSGIHSVLVLGHPTAPPGSLDGTVS